VTPRPRGAPRSSALLAFTLALWLAAGGCAALGRTSAPQMTVGQLARDPAAFDGKLVTVTGQVANVRLWPGFRSRPKHIFDLRDDSRGVSVLWGGWPVCRSGSSALVDGRYRQRDDLITASWVSCS
jgi:hypothetical protein